VAVVIGAGVAGWAVFVTLQVLAAGHADQRGLAAVNQARGELSASDLMAGRALGPLAVAQADFHHAHGLLGSAWLAPVRIFPVIGRQVTSVDDLSASAERVAQVGQTTVSGVGAALKRPHLSGPQRVAVLADLSSVAGQADKQLGGLSYGPSKGLIGAVARRRSELINDVAKVRSELNKAALVTGVVGHQMTAGARYLVLEANNAEMRSGSGMLLQAGVLTVGGGDLVLGPTRPTGDLTLSPPGVPIGGDLAARWGWLHPGQDWRNLATTPQFDVTAPLAAQMWQAATGQHVDGVLVLDDVAIQALLAATGPVSVGSTTVGPDNALTFLTKTQYLQPDETVRKEELGALAQAAVASVEHGQGSLSTMATGLAAATAGRHVLLWSSDISVESAYRTLGVAGTVAPDDLLVGVLNGGANKLDPYLSVQIQLSLRPAAAATQVTVRVDVANDAPTGLPPYVTGEAASLAALRQQPGVYAGLLSANLPGSATNGGIAGYSSLAAAGREGPLTVLAVPFRLQPGHRQEFVVTFQLPGRHGAFEVIPSARLPSVTWQTPKATFTDSQPHQVSY
jgi:hypothetical protein